MKKTNPSTIFYDTYGRFVCVCTIFRHVFFIRIYGFVSKQDLLKVLVDLQNNEEDITQIASQFTKGPFTTLMWAHVSSNLKDTLLNNPKDDSVDITNGFPPPGSHILLYNINDLKLSIVVMEYQDKVRRTTRTISFIADISQVM